MPAYYAHYRFGKQVLPSLPADVRQCIQRFRRMYDMGLHGPDIFFYYYNPLNKAVGADLARAFHRQSGREFFTRACAQAQSEAALAYLYGLLAHYCLDSTCHPFVHKMVDIGEARHVALESEFERYLMAKDGIAAPHTHNRGEKLKLTRGECMTVAGFYPPASGGNVIRSVRNMAFSLKFLASPSRDRNRLILEKLSPALTDQLIPEAPVEDFTFMIGELQTLYDEAAARFPELLDMLKNHMQTGQALTDAFETPFG